MTFSGSPSPSGYVSGTDYLFTIVKEVERLVWLVDGRIKRPKQSARWGNKVDRNVPWACFHHCLTGYSNLLRVHFASCRHHVSKICSIVDVFRKLPQVLEDIKWSRRTGNVNAGAFLLLFLYCRWSHSFIVQLLVSYFYTFDIDKMAGGFFVTRQAAKEGKGELRESDMRRSALSHYKWDVRQRRVPQNGFQLISHASFFRLSLLYFLYYFPYYNHHSYWATPKSNFECNHCFPKNLKYVISSSFKYYLWCAVKMAPGAALLNWTPFSCSVLSF